jgi:hypothetical protein
LSSFLVLWFCPMLPVGPGRSENSRAAAASVPSTCGTRFARAVEKAPAALTQFFAASPRPEHYGFLLEGRRLHVSLLDVWGRCLPNTCGGGGRLPYASSQRTRYAVAATPLNRASLRPTVRQRFIHLLVHLLISTPSVRVVFWKHPWWRLQRRSPPRSAATAAIAPLAWPPI